MSQSRIVRFIIIGLLATLAWQLPVEGAVRWYKLYKGGRIGQLIAYQRQGQIGDAYWNRFVSALTVTNGDSAVTLYKTIYAETADRDLKKSIREKLTQYFYAKGYYETAEKIRRMESQPGIFPEKPEANSFYGIQIGAYSTLTNARAARQKLLNKFQPVSIINKIRNNRKLYLVVVGKYTSRRSAEKALSSIKSRIQGFIIEF